MAEWMYFVHPPRDDFAATMSDAERDVWARHFEHLKRELAAGRLVIAGPTLTPVNTDVVVFEADDEAQAQEIMQSDPAVASGIGRGELRRFSVSLLRGRDY
jgi:uncharacterized protein YciI